VEAVVRLGEVLVVLNHLGGAELVILLADGFEVGVVFDVFGKGRFSWQDFNGDNGAFAQPMIVGQETTARAFDGGRQVPVSSIR
jgi:hypothetical protein